MESVDNENKKILSAGELAREAVSVLIEKKALNVRLFEVGKDNPVTDFYVNATGRSSTQVASLADELVYRLGLLGRDTSKVEGRGGNSWILVDYGDVIVNVFDQESREFYGLDRLIPSDAERSIADIVAQVDKKLEINKTEG